MKKIIALFVFVISLLTFYQIFYIVSCYQIGEVHQLDKQFQTEQKSVYLSAKDETSMEMFHHLNTLANKYDFSYSIASYGLMEGSHIEYEDIYLYTNEHINEDFFFLEGQPFIDFTSLTDQYYSAELTDKKATGYIITLNNERFIKQNSIPRFFPILQIENILSSDNKDFFVTIYLSKDMNLNTIINEYNNQDSFEMLASESHPLTIETQTEAVVGRVQLLLMVSFFMTMTFISVYILNNRRDYLIRKMNGISTVNIFLSMYMKFIIFLVIDFFVGLNVCYLIWIGSFNQVTRLFYFELLKIFVIVNIGFVVLSLFIIGFINIQSSLRFLKMKQQYQYMFPVHQLIKTILITVLILPILVSIQDMAPYIVNYASVKSIENKVDHYYIYRKYIKSDKAFFDRYFDSGIYCDFHEYYNYSLLNPFNELDEMDIESFYPYPYIIVNENYLNDYELYYENGSKLSFEDINKDVFLVPLAYKGKDLSRYGYLTNDNIIYIKNTGQFTNIEMYSIYAVKNPIIQVVQEYRIDLSNSYLIFDIQNETEKANLIKELKIMNEVGYIHDDNTLITSVKQAYDYYIRELKDGIILFLIVIIIYVLLLISLIYQSSSMYIHEFGKQKMIEYFQGKSYIKRYSVLYLCNVFTTLLPSLMAIYIYKLPVILVLQYTLICIVTEFIIEMLLIQRMERKSSIHILNGKID